MDSTAKIASKGQVTIPKSVRDALELHEGDELRSGGPRGTRCFTGPETPRVSKRH